MHHRLKLVGIMLVLSVASAVAADWPWVYGPRRDHTSEQKELRRTWPQAGPTSGWSDPDPRCGWGSPHEEAEPRRRSLMRLRWTEAAAADLERLADYLMVQAPDRAPRLVKSIYETPETLLAFPHQGRPGKKAGTRELVLSVDRPPLESTWRTTVFEGEPSC